MIKSIIFLLATSWPITSIFTQDVTDRQAIETVINDIFDGMRNADSSAVSALLHPSARLQNLSQNDEGISTIQTEAIQDWLQAIVSYPAGTLDERLNSMAIEVDGDLASVWTDYAFYGGGNFIHCGVNAFQLFRSKKGWIVHQITDTRRKDNCMQAPQSMLDSIHAFVDTWHKAAAVADEDLFFRSMAKGGIYLGTDASERWERDVFKAWAAFAFERSSAWDFTARDRQVYFTPNKRHFWWEEMLDTWMGVCRGSGVAEWEDGRWQILHYDLSIMVPNDKVQGFLELMKDD